MPTIGCDEEAEEEEEEEEVEEGTEEWSVSTPGEAAIGYGEEEKRDCAGPSEEPREPLRDASEGVRSGGLSGSSLCALRISNTHESRISSLSKTAVAWGLPFVQMSMRVGSS